jgi:hypothetical protein
LGQYLKKQTGGFFLHQHFILRSVPVADYRDITWLTIGESEVSNPSRIAVPEIEHPIAEHTDGINAISVPVADYRDIT